MTNARVIAFSPLRIKHSGPARTVRADEIHQVESRKRMGLPTLFITTGNGEELLFGHVENDDLDAVLTQVQELAASGIPDEVAQGLADEAAQKLADEAARRLARRFHGWSAGQVC